MKIVFSKIKMVRKKILIVCLFICFVIVRSDVSFAQCTARSIIKNCKSRFEPPYTYSGCWMKEFFLTTKYQRVEGHFVALEGLKYQILFCSSGSAEGVTVNIYDKSIESVKKRKLYDSSKNQSCNLWKFEPAVSGDYYIEYIIPPTSTGKAHTGCVMLMLGTIIETETKK